MAKRILGNQTKTILKIRIGSFYIELGKQIKEFTNIKDLLEGIKGLSTPSH